MHAKVRPPFTLRERDEELEEKEPAHCSLYTLSFQLESLHFLPGSQRLGVAKCLGDGSHMERLRHALGPFLTSHAHHSPQSSSATRLTS